MKNITLNFLENMYPMLERIQQKKQLIEKARPLPTSAIQRIKHDMSLEWTYNSNSIEGNTLTLAETRVVLEDGLTIGGKSLSEHFETINHDKAITYLEEIVHPDYRIRMVDLMHIHELIMTNIDKEYAGRVRNGMVRIVGANFIPPSPDKVSDLLMELIDFVNNNPLILDPAVLAAIFHHRFVWIHPFFDGNGRTGRLAMNLLLMQYGYPPAIILKNDRAKYYTALNAANKGDYEKITLMVLQALERSLNMYINIIPDAYQEYQNISAIVEEEDIPYGIEYISLLARTGKIDAYKEGRNWVTSKNAVLDYLHRKDNQNSITK
jgi:Fic family protein